MLRFISIIALLVSIAASTTASTTAVSQPAKANTTDRLDETVRITLNNLVKQQRSNGTFNDFTKGTAGGSGLVPLGYAALAAAKRSDNQTERDAWIRMADRTIKKNRGDNQILPKFPVAMILTHNLHKLLPKKDGNYLISAAKRYKRLHAPGIADLCFQQSSCFNNYKLFNASLNMELVATGYHGRSGSRLANPKALRQQTINYLKVRPAQIIRPGARTLVNGHTKVAGTLSDPVTYPVAYHAMSTALLVHAQSRMGSRAPRGVRSASHRALWGLLGLAAPNGEISWMGRGQDQPWTLAASLYAAAEGARLFRKSDPEMARRLHRLSQIEVIALDHRRNSRGFSHAPGRVGSGNEGIDHYASAIGNTGLALMFMEMARPAIKANQSTLKPLAIPAEGQGGGYTDRVGAHVLTVRSGSTWMAVHILKDRTDDGRQDIGLIRALRIDKNGVWRNSRHQLPGHRAGIPTAHPRLNNVSANITSAGIRGHNIITHGRWGSTPFTSVYSSFSNGARQSISCPRGHNMSWVEYLPNHGRISRAPTRITRSGFTLRLNQRASFVTIGHFASARSRRLVGYRVSTRCLGKPVSIKWSGTVRAPG